MKPLLPAEDTRLEHALRRLQILLPLGILVAVAIYSAGFEMLLQGEIAAWLHFALEFLLFGVLGAVAVWVALEWVRRVVVERERAQAEIRDLNRRLEVRVAQRTRELAEANAELRKRHHELEQANQNLKQLDELKSEFVSLVSHELRAPLANISGSLELLLADESKMDANQRELLTLADEQVARLARLVRGILNVSRIEAGQTVLQMQAFDAHALLERTLAQWQACDPEHHYTLDAPSNLPSVWADRDRVEEVLTNLLENAFKYSEPGTDITVTADARDDALVITVHDQGKGIPPDELQRIFDKFYRVERTDARKTYGYGLGLYISFKLMEAMGGSLWAESDLDQGSRFSISLPLAGHVVTRSPILAPAYH